jgi:predicted nucleotidyltransferase
MDLAAELEGALPRELRLPVDVRVLNNAPAGFQYHAYRGQLLFSRDDELWGRLVEWAVWSYLDMKPLLERALKEAMTA